MTSPTGHYVKDSFDAIMQGDMKRLATCFTPDARIWHNHDEVEQSIEQVCAVLGHLHAISHSVAYTDQTITQAGNLFFSKHILNADLKNGKTLRMHAMMQMQTNEDGIITRLDEYLDSKVLHVLA